MSGQKGLIEISSCFSRNDLTKKQRIANAVQVTIRLSEKLSYWVDDNMTLAAPGVFIFLSFNDTIISCRHV